MSGGCVAGAFQSTHPLRGATIVQARDVQTVCAFRDIEPMRILWRTVRYGMEHYPELDKEGHWQRMLEHLAEKYDYSGYLKLYIPESRNAAGLQELRDIIHDPARLRDIFENYYKEEKLRIL